MKTPQHNPNLLSRRDLAARWQVSEMTLKRKEKAGELPFLKIGKVVRYKEADVEQYERDAYVGFDRA